MQQVTTGPKCLVAGVLIYCTQILMESKIQSFKLSSQEACLDSGIHYSLLSRVLQRVPIPIPTLLTSCTHGFWAVFWHEIGGCGWVTGHKNCGGYGLGMVNKSAKMGGRWLTGTAVGIGCMPFTHTTVFYPHYRYCLWPLSTVQSTSAHSMPTCLSHNTQHTLNN